jgi:hypothetical protein
MNDTNKMFWENVHRNNDRKNIFFAKSRVIEVNVSEIQLSEKCHIRDNKNYNKRAMPNTPIVVRYSQGKFYLVSGITAYKKALDGNIETLNAVLFHGGRLKFLKTVGFESFKAMPKYHTMNIDGINITNNFIEHPPKQHKLDAVEKFFLQHGRLDKPVTVTYTNFLVDGYARYLIAKKHGLQDVNVEIVTFGK